MTDLSSAMKFMAQAKHIGKIVLTNHENTEVRRAILDRAPVREDGTYLITGGMGGLGLRITRWLLEQGARSIVLMGRNPASLEVEAQLQEMRRGDIRLEAVAADVSIPRDVERVVQWIRHNLPPLRGLIHAAMVLEDTPIEALRPDAMERVMKPKVAGAWNLHVATKGDPLDFFVCFSSIASLLGNGQQANYAAANCFLDALAPFRRARGLPATTINWGVISGSGYVARHREVQEFLDRQGYLSLNEEQLLAAFDSLLTYAPPQIMAARIDWTKLAEQSPRVAASPRIRHLPAAGKGTVAHADGSSILCQLGNDDPGQRASHLETYLRDQVARLLGASPSTIDIERPISDMGLDSLIAVELTVILERDLRVEFPNTGLIGASVRGLGQDLLRLLSFNVSGASAPTNMSQEDAEQDMAAEDQETIVAAPQGVAAPPAEPAPLQPSIPLPEVTHTKELTGSASNGHGLDYSALDYADWSPTQRAIRIAIKVGFGALGKIETRGLENIPREGGCLLAVNHLSMADVPLLLTLLSRRAIILANDRLKQNGIIDWFISDMGQAIYVSREHADAESLERALTVLRSGGLIALAPEGTRSRNGELLRGKTGVAWLATQTGVPVVPLAAWGQEYWRDRWKHMRRIPIQVYAGPPIQLPKGAASPAQLRQYTDRIMSGIAALLPKQYRGVYSGSAFEETVTTKDV